MSSRRRYQLLCPIARALDVVGDRWALLILRDLQAAPARFQELEQGLGIATNLLTTRLKELTAAGLVQKSERGDGRAYELTDLGRLSDRLLWELARFGSLFDHDADPRPTPNVRAAAVPLRMMLRDAEAGPTLTARLEIDGDWYTIVSDEDGVEVIYGPTTIEPDVVARTPYEAFLDVGEGAMSVEDYSRDHLEITMGADRRRELYQLLAPLVMPTS